MRISLKRAIVFIFFAVACSFVTPLGAQVAVLLEQPYGFFGTLNPTGHISLYFGRICAETPIKLRRCEPGELGAVVTRRQGISGYDWVVIPVIPYLYSVENASEVPARVDRNKVRQLRNAYHEAHLMSLGADLIPGNFWRGGWTGFVGESYERRVYAFRFETTEAQDDELMARLNSQPNRTRFSLLYGNCADFARTILDFYIPGVFPRNIFQDAGITTPKQTIFKLVRYARKHTEMHLTVFEIPQIPGYRRHSRSNKTATEALTTSVYVIPIALASPYLAGGLFVDFLAIGNFNPVPPHPTQLTPATLMALTAPTYSAENLDSASAQARSAAGLSETRASEAEAVHSGLTEIKVSHE